MSHPRYWKVADVARLMSISPDCALRALKSGAIPGIEQAYQFEARSGARWRVRREAFDPWWKDRAADEAIQAETAN